MGQLTGLHAIWGSMKQQQWVVGAFSDYDIINGSEDNFFLKKMEDLSLTMMGERDAFDPPRLPSLIQYGVKFPFRVAIVGQTDSGKCI